METVKSPCILVCAIEPTSGHCYGCGRTRDEIATWLDMSDHERTQLLEKVLPERVSKLECRPRRVTRRSRQRGVASRRNTLDLSS